MLGTTNVKVKPNKKVNYIEYIESTGTQYIDTGFVPNQNSSIEMIVQFNNVTDTETLYCSRVDGASNTLTSFKLATKWRVDYNITQQTISGVTINTSSKYKFYVNKNKVYLNEVLKHTFTSKTVSPTDTWTLMASRINGSDLNNYGRYRLYGCKIWDNDTLIRNFKPYKDGAGVYCLFDEVEKKYYYNQGTGSFIGGDSI